MAKIFITRSIPDQALTMLKEAFGENEVEVYPNDQIMPREEMAQAVNGREAVLCMLTDPWDAAMFDAAGDSLKVLANCAVGYNNIQIDSATERNVTVTNTPDVLTEATADLAWACIMGASRRTGEAERYLRAGRWDSWSPNFMLGNEIYGKTLGIYSMGRIGQATARRALGFNMKVIYNSRTQRSAEEESALNMQYVSFDELLEQSDILSIHCPLLPETAGLFGEAEFKKMKNSAVLVNTSRGPVVNEEALARALKNGDIGFAGIDVFEKEPEIHPELLECENALLLPHIGSATLETRTEMACLAVENIIAVLNGNTPRTPVN